MFQNFDLCHSMNAFDPSWIMSGFMEDNFLGDEEVNPLTGYSESFKRSLSPTSLKLYEEFERASQNFETLKSEGKPLGDAIHHHYLSEQAFNDRQEDSFKNEARSQFYQSVKERVVDTTEWAVENPFAAAYATGEMALSTAGAVMTGGRNAYEVAFHGKQLKAAAFETALAFGVLKYGVKGVSRLVARGVEVKKLSLVGEKPPTIQKLSDLHNAPYIHQSDIDLAITHSFNKHFLRARYTENFKGLGIRTKQQLSDKMNHMLRDPKTLVKKLEKGRVAYYNEESSLLFIHNTQKVNKSTVFQPGPGKQYFNNLG